MKYILSLCLLVGIMLSCSVSAHEEEDIYNLFSQERKEVIESKLSIFLAKVDKFELIKQQKIYTQLHDRIQAIQTKYSSDSPQYTILHMVSTLLEHKLDNNIILSNTQLLDHVIYGLEYQHYSIISVPESEDDPSDDREIIFREDLNQGDLNEYEKDILAGTSAGVMSLDIRANLEPIDVETVEFRFNQDIDDIGLSGNIYHDGIFVGRASASDVDNDTMIFSNISDLIVPIETSYLQLELVTENIGKDFIGKAKNEIQVLGVVLKDNKGTITGDSIGDANYNFISRPFSIVPSKLTVTTDSIFEYNNRTAGLLVTYNSGRNNESGSDIQASITGVDILVSSVSTPGDISIFNGNGEMIGSSSIASSGRVTITVVSDPVSSRGEIYRFETTARASFYLPQDAIKYSAGSYNLETNLGQQIPLGQY